MQYNLVLAASKVDGDNQHIHIIVLVLLGGGGDGKRTLLMGQRLNLSTIEVLLGLTDDFIVELVHKISVLDAHSFDNAVEALQAGANMEVQGLAMKVGKVGQNKVTLTMEVERIPTVITEMWI